MFFFALFGIWNVAVFIMYGIDKKRARKNKWRISERTLIGVAFLMGGPGAVFGMHVFRHKTQKISFRILISVAVLVNAAILIFIERI